MGQIIKAVVDGEEREFEILQHTQSWTHAINMDGEIVSAELRGPIYTKIGLRLVHTQHQFGPITYEETGEYTQQDGYVPGGVYYLDPFTGVLVCHVTPRRLSTKSKIVKPLI